MKVVAKKSLLLFLVLLLFLCSCGNQKENEPDPVTPPPIEPPQPQPEVPDPDEWTPEELNAIEEFKNQPKNDWGYDDLAIYTVEGKVIVSALDSIDGGTIPSIRYKKSITYRGVKPGDDAIETFQRLDIPKGAIYKLALPEGKPEPADEPAYEFDLAEVESKIDDIVSVLIYLDEDYNVVPNVIDSWPLIEPTGAQWVIQCSVKDGAITDFGAGYIRYIHYEPGQI